MQLLSLDLIRQLLLIINYISWEEGEFVCVCVCVCRDWLALTCGCKCAHTHTHSYIHTLTHTHTHTHTHSHTHNRIHNVMYLYILSLIISSTFRVLNTQGKFSRTACLGFEPCNLSTAGWKPMRVLSSPASPYYQCLNVCILTHTHTHTHTHTQHRVQRDIESTQNRFPTNTIAA